MALFQGSLANLIGIKRCFSNGIKAKRGTDSCWGWIWPWLSAEHPCRVQGGHYTPGDSSEPYQFPSPCSEPILGTLPKPRLEQQSPRFSSISGLSGASSTIWQNNLHGTGKRGASRAPASASDPHPARQRPHLRPSLCCPAVSSSTSVRQKAGKAGIYPASAAPSEPTCQAAPQRLGERFAQPRLCNRLPPRTSVPKPVTLAGSETVRNAVRREICHRVAAFTSISESNQEPHWYGSPVPFTTSCPSQAKCAFFS